MRTFLFRAIVIFLCFAVNAGAWFGVYLITKTPGADEVTVVIPKGAGVRQIKTILGEHGIIRDDVRFLILVRLLRLSGDNPQLRAGEFKVPHGLTPRQVLRFLETAKPILYRVTVPEGKTMIQIADIFAREKWADPETFLQLCKDKEFVQSLGITAESLEGYLFPETYSLAHGETNEKSIITSMVHRFTVVWNELEKPKDSQLNRHQLVTLASIVEKETGAAGERATIAGVFYNRLKKGMKLQSDPTTIYGIKDFNGNLTRADLKKATPYNTYVIPALPPGPICNPGRSAFEAVLQPKKVPYFYFVSQNNGSHYFSTSLKEHNRAVYKYQKSRKLRAKQQK